MKKVDICLVIFSLILSINLVTASMLIPADQKAKDNSQAPEHSPVIGENWDLERIDFIHYVKPQEAKAQGQKTETCYKLMGVKWTSFPVSYIINPTNQQGLSQDFISSAISNSAETWDYATSKELFNTYTINYTAQYGIQDFKNTIVFGDYSDSNVIAVTSVWYTRIGKRIIEFDQLYNTDFIWGDVFFNTTVMDLQNIATHELGHAVGLGDIYNQVCNSVTMYGYSGYGETSKRTLEKPDITGLQKLYGL